MKVVTLLLILSVSSCGADTSLEPIRHERVLIDRSLSVPEELFSRFEDRVLQEGDVWAKSARPGETLGIWWFPEDATFAYPARDTTFTMAELQVPVHLHRKRSRETLHRGLLTAVSNIPPAKKTPLLDALYYIQSSVPRKGRWNLTIYSDLLHDGKTWSFPDNPAEWNDDAILEQMKRLCPAVPNPPARILLVTWPGILGRGSISPEVHQHVIALYETFFKTWSPGSEVEIGSIY